METSYIKDRILKWKERAPLAVGTKVYHLYNSSGPAKFEIDETSIVEICIDEKGIRLRLAELGKVCYIFRDAGRSPYCYTYDSR